MDFGDFSDMFEDGDALPSTDIGNGLMSGITGGTGFDPSMLDSTQIGNGFIPGITEQSGLSGANTATSASSFLQKLLGGSQPGQNLADLSKVLGSFSQGEKANRVVQGDFTQKYDNNMLAAQQARNTNESDALRKLGTTNYLSHGGSHFQLPPSISLGGTQHAIPDLGMSPLPASQAQQQGAKTLESQLLSRLMPGGSYTPQPLSTYANPGTSEQVGNFGALGTGGLGTVANLFQKN